MKEKWNIRPRGHRCASTGRQFEEGELVYSVLRMAAEEDSLERSDYSEAAWRQAPATRAPSLSQWTSRYQPPPPHNPRSEPTKESPGDLLRRLVEEDHPSTENARFVLALLLERRKQLRETARTTDQSGSRILHYELRESGELFLIRDPALHLDDLSQVQAEVSALLASPPPLAPRRDAVHARRDGAPPLRFLRRRMRGRRPLLAALRRRRP